MSGEIVTTRSELLTAIDDGLYEYFDNCHEGPRIPRHETIIIADKIINRLLREKSDT